MFNWFRGIACRPSHRTLLLKLIEKVNIIMADLAKVTADLAALKTAAETLIANNVDIKAQLAALIATGGFTHEQQTALDAIDQSITDTNAEIAAQLAPVADAPVVPAAE
jgi:alkylhydroperoxidase family enzyme